MLLYAADESALTQQEKIEKRLQFNQFVEEGLAREERRKIRRTARPAIAQPEKNWSISATPSYGYDRNVNLDSQKKGDTFFEEAVEGKISFQRPEASFLGAGRWGLRAGGDRLNYTHEKNANYQQLTAGAFMDSRLSEKLVFKLDYDLSHLDYPHDKQLKYLSNKFKPVLSYAWNDQWLQTFYHTYEFKDYSSRRALTADNLSQKKDRFDFYFESGTTLRFIPRKDRAFGGSLGYKRNNSNDLFHDFNDYEGLKTSCYAFFQLSSNASLIGFGGYDYKRYDARTFLVDSDRTQEDHFFYLGGTAYYDFCKYYQLFLSYLYKQNYSNAPAQSYSGYTLSAGFTSNF